MRVIHTAEKAVTIWYIGEPAPSLPSAMAIVRGCLLYG